MSITATSTSALNILKRDHDGNIELTQMVAYHGGVLVLFTHDRRVLEHRVAYFEYISIEASNDTLVKKFDYVC